MGRGRRRRQGRGPAPPSRPRSPLRGATGTGIVLLVLLSAAWWLWRGEWTGAEDGAGVPTAAPPGETAVAASSLEDGRGARGGAAPSETAEAALGGPVRRLRALPVARYPHDPGAFTQGLLLDAGTLYESTGQYGRSSLRRVEVESGRVLAERRLPDDRFGEGLARVPGVDGEGDRLVQLTWREGVAAVWRLDGLERVGEHRYEGEGWGLCHDDAVAGGRLVMSDGSDRLTFRDPLSFTVTGAVAVTLEDRPVGLLNELECVAGRVLANVLGRDQILEIDPATGRVVALIDASGLLTAEERAGTDVLNGIAHDPADGTLLLTGKLWPWVFRVEIADLAPS